MMPGSLKDLRSKYDAAVEEAIGRARASGGREVIEAPDGAEIYSLSEARRPDSMGRQCR